MRVKLYIALTALLAALGAYFGWRYYTDAWLPNRQVSEAVKAQNELVERLRPAVMRLPELYEPEETVISDSAEEPAQTDFLAELKAYNPDAVGWLIIDGTSVDYPIVKSGDNEFYLRNGFDRKYNYVGCPFLDFRCEGFDGLNAIVYAHHIKGEMFGDVARFRDADFMRGHPTAELLTADGLHKVAFFAYLTVPSDSPVYETAVTEPEKYIDLLFESANYTLGAERESLKSAENLRLLLLSTCTYEFEDARGVLVGVIE